MCTFTCRVSRCGHYTKTLWNPYDEAKKAKKVCDSGSENLSTTGGFCYLDGCDRKAGGLRDSLSKSYWLYLAGWLSILLKAT
jgi:hypothetical protein